VDTCGRKSRGHDASACRELSELPEYIGQIMILPEGNADRLAHLFANLDRWRHLPNYQLERRADIFFSVYLRELVAAHVGCALSSVIIPEMPLKRSMVVEPGPGNLSVKVDYVLFSEDRQQVFFVEFKTDQDSRRSGQDQYLTNAVRVGFREILRVLVEILGATSSRRKYYHLLHLLAQAGQIRLGEELCSRPYPDSDRGLKYGADCVEITASDKPIRVIYIQPKASDGCECIDFGRIVAHLKPFHDPFTRLFCEYLQRWQVAAGTEAPSSL
jgi:hypothetical protein